MKKAKSFGLLGLKERAAKVDGWLDISSTRRGTSVILSVPLATPSSAEGGEGDFNHGDKNNDQSDFV